jgi:RNA polymerase sigma-70 factor (ECF subfamily)
MPSSRATDPRFDEATLVAAAANGEPAAFRALVRRYERAVFSQLRAVLLPSGRTSLVEDLAQETFLRAFRALPRYVGDGRAKFSTWLLTIATRLALNELRRRQGVLFDFDTMDAQPATEGDPRRDAPMIGRGIEAAVMSLSPPLRAAFLLRELHGFEYAEVATALDVDLGTVKSRLSRARARLREILGDASGELPVDVLGGEG